MATNLVGGYIPDNALMYSAGGLGGEAWPSILSGSAPKETWSQIQKDFQPYLPDPKQDGSTAEQSAAQQTLNTIQRGGWYFPGSSTEYIGLPNQKQVKYQVLDQSKVTNTPGGAYTPMSNYKTISIPDTGMERFLQTAGPIVGSALIGNAVGGAIGDIAGYQPAVADSVWSAGATPTSSGLAQAGISAGTGLVKSGLNNMMGSGTASRTTTGGGSNMAGTSFLDNLTLGNLAGGLGGVVDYATTGKQQDIMQNAYSQAQNLITQPSPEQAAIRQKTMGMINNPSSFFQDPLYQAAFGQGQQALERSQASGGFAGSGKAATELQAYGQTMGANMYNQELQTLSGLSGITQDPLMRQVGAETLLKGATSQADMLGNKTGALMQGANSLLGTNPSSILQNLLTGSGGTSLGNTSISSLWSGINNMFSGGSTSSDLGNAFSGIGSLSDTGGGLSDFAMNQLF